MASLDESDAEVEVTHLDLLAAAQDLQRIAAAGEHFLAGHPEHADSLVRLDLIVIVPGQPPQHFPDAWQQDGDDSGW